MNDLLNGFNNGRDKSDGIGGKSPFCDMNMFKTKAKLENIDGVDYLTFKVNEEVGLTQLPVITKGTRKGTNCWTWNGSLEKPTLRPSIRTGYYNGKEMTEIHYWLNDGIADCLSDCKDGNAGNKIQLKAF
jgi:Family of unknown function (DUF6527)